jgi:hypothetical protein
VADALAEAFAYARQHWARVQPMDDLAGYLFRVAQSELERASLIGVVSHHGRGLARRGPV